VSVRVRPPAPLGSGNLEVTRLRQPSSDYLPGSLSIEQTGSCRRPERTSAIRKPTLASPCCEIRGRIFLISPTNLAVVVQDFLLGRSLLLLIGFNESTGVVSLESGKTHKVPDPESRDATRQFNRPLARGIASPHRKAECSRAQTRNLRNKFCPWKGICQPDCASVRDWPIA
jgi:hypothetical protein